MSGILLPEIIIYNTLESIINIIKKDLQENLNNDKETILYKILGVDEDANPIKMNTYNYFNQAKKIFSLTNNLSVNFGYNQNVSSAISLHILLPSENSSTTIGLDEGYITDDIVDSNGSKTATQQYFTQMFDTTYQIIIASNNSSEVNVVYNIFKSMLLMLFPNLEMLGIRLPSLSGNDIIMKDDLIPIPIFQKVINISFKYEHNVQQLLINKVAKKFNFELKAIEENE